MNDDQALSARPCPWPQWVGPGRATASPPPAVKRGRIVLLLSPAARKAVSYHISPSLSLHRSRCRNDPAGCALCILVGRVAQW